MTDVTKSFDDDERALAHALHERVDQMNDSPLGVRDIEASARRIRRNRLVIIGAGVAAAIAVIVPTALIAADLNGRDRTPPPASQSPSQPPTASPSEATDSGTPDPSPTASSEKVLDVAGLDTGAPPALEWAEISYERDVPYSVLHTLDGRIIELPPYNLTEFASLGDGWVVDMYDAARDRELVYLVSSTGEYAEPADAAGGIAVSAGGNVVAWTSPDGTVYAAHGDTGDVLTMPAIPGTRGDYRTVGVLGEDCKEGRTTDAGCTVVVNRTDERGKAFASTSHGIVEPVPGMIGAAIAEAGVIGGVTSIDESLPGSCSRLLDSSFATRWETCDNNLGELSPDGSLLLGLPAYLDGFGPTTLDLLDATDGTPVRSWTSNRRSATYFEETWEDDSHVLLVTYQGGDWAVVRLGVDGALEYAKAPVAGDEFSRPVILPER